MEGIKNGTKTNGETWVLHLIQYITNDHVCCLQFMYDPMQNGWVFLYWTTITNHHFIRLLTPTRGLLQPGLFTGPVSCIPIVWVALLHIMLLAIHCCSSNVTIPSCCDVSNWDHASLGVVHHDTYSKCCVIMCYMLLYCQLLCTSNCSIFFSLC